KAMMDNARFWGRGVGAGSKGGESGGGGADEQEGAGLPAIAICHSEPGAWALPEPAYQTSRCPPAEATIRIGRTMFETDRLPRGRFADESVTGPDGRSRPKPFRFLSIFKWEERKNWAGLLEAYIREFMSAGEAAAKASPDSLPPAADNVVLYILTSAYHSDD